MKKIAVLGSGSWATALVKVFCENTSQIAWWIHEKKIADFIKLNASNPNHLKNVKLPLGRLNIYTDLNTLIENYDYLVLAIPSIYIKEILGSINKPIDQKIFISSIKGIIPENHLSVIDYLKSTYKVEEKNLGVIAGPCHAEEVALCKTSYLTIAFREKKKADFIAKSLNCTYIKTHYLDDVEGVTLASILKNIFAISSGIAEGLGYGDNFQAVLISNSIREMQVILDKIYPSLTRNINNSAYLGDLLVTSYSKFSRNKTLGRMLGEGKSLEFIFTKMNMIAEGYYATKGIYETYLKKVSMPIIETTYKILYKNHPSELAFKELKQKLN